MTFRRTESDPPVPSKGLSYESDLNFSIYSPFLIDFHDGRSIRSFSLLVLVSTVV